MECKIEISNWSFDNFKDLIKPNDFDFEICYNFKTDKIYIISPSRKAGDKNERYFIETKK